MKSINILAIDAALSIEDKLINHKVGIRDVTVNSAGRINTWAHGTVPPRFRDNIVGSYDARATVEMIAEDLLASPNFVKAHA